MTKEELSEWVETCRKLVVLHRNSLSSFVFQVAVVQLADERDAVAKQAGISNARLMDMTEQAMEARRQRDRALVLLRSWMDAEEGAEPSMQTHEFLSEVDGQQT